MKIVTLTVVLVLLQSTLCVLGQIISAPLKFDQGSYSGTEGMSIKVCLSIDVLATIPGVNCVVTVTVKAQTSAGSNSATFDDDYTLNDGLDSAIVNFTSTNAKSICFDVELKNDDMVEGDEVFILCILADSLVVSGSNCESVFAFVTTATAMVTISDNPSNVVHCKFNNRNETVEEGKDDSVSLTASCRGRYQRTISIAVICNPTMALTVRPASNPDDFSLETEIFQFEFDDGDQETSTSNNTLTISIIDDDLAEERESFICTLQSGSTQSVQSEDPEQVTIDIIDDDELIIHWERNFYKFTEAGPAKVELVTNSSVKEDFTVFGGPVQISNGIMTREFYQRVIIKDILILNIPYRTFTFEGTAYGIASVSSPNITDVTETNNAFTFTNGSKSATSIFTHVDDKICEGDELYMATFSLESNARSGFRTRKAQPNITYIAIEDDDSTLINFNQSSYCVTERDGHIDISVTSTGAFLGLINVNVSCFGGTATAGVDFEAGIYNTSFSVDEKMSSLESFPIRINITNDNVDEPDECFLCRITAVDGLPCAIIGTNTETQICIRRFCAPPVTINNETVVEGNTAKIRLELNDTLSDDCNITVQTMDETAVASDYVSGEYTVVVPAGERIAYLMVETIDDDIAELTEFFTARITQTCEGSIISEQQNTSYVTILDNDNITCSKAPGNVTVTEGGVAELTVVCSGQSEFNFTLFLDTMDGSAVAPGDYTSGGYSLSFTAGQTSGTLSVSTEDIAIADCERFFKVMITGSDNPDSVLIGDPHTCYVTIEDNNVLMVMFEPDGYEFPEGEIANVMLVTNLPYSFDFSVVVGCQNGSAVAPGDFNAGEYTVNFPASLNVPGRSSFDVQTLSDNIFEDVESFKCNILRIMSDEKCSDVLSGPQDMATVNITDSTVVCFDPKLYRVTEGDDVTLTLVTNLTVAKEFSVMVTTVDGTAMNSSDYFGGTKTAIFEIGSSTATVTYSTVNDSIREVQKFFTAQLSVSNEMQAMGVSVGEDCTARVDITDNDALFVMLETTICNTRECDTLGGNAMLEVALVASTTCDEEYTVIVTASDVTAKESEDYFGQSFNVTFPPFETRVPFNITIACDNIAELDEIFTLQLEPPQNMDGKCRDVQLGTPVRTNCTIEDEDTITCSKAPENATVTEGGVAELTVECSGQYEFEFTLFLDTMDGSAVAPGDYASGGYSLSFTAGQPSSILSVSTSNDTIAELEEYFKVMITGSDRPGKVIIGDPDTCFVTIQDNDVITCSKAPENATVTEGGVAGFTVECSGQYEFDFTLFLDTMDGSALAPGDYTSGGYSLSFSAGQASGMISVQTLDDTIAECDEFFKVMITRSNRPDKVIIGDPDTCYATIQDDNDDAGLEVCINVTSVSCLENVGMCQVCVVANRPAECEYSLSLNTEDGTAVAPEDYISGEYTIIFPPFETVQCINVEIVDDNCTEDRETFSLEFSIREDSPFKNVQFCDETDIPIVDNDVQVNFTKEMYDVNEGRTIPLSLTISGDTSMAFEVEIIVTSDGKDGAAGSQDFTGVPRLVDIPRGLLGITFDFMAICDNITEDLEFVELEIVIPGQYIYRVKAISPITTRVNIIDICTGPQIGTMPVNDSVIADPLFTVPLRTMNTSNIIEGTPLCYEVHGRADRYFNLVSDDCTSVNAHYVAAVRPRAGNVIGQIGIVTSDSRDRCHQIQVDVTTDGQCQTQIDGVVISLGTTNTTSTGVNIMAGRHYVRVSTPNCAEQALVMWIRCHKPTLNQTGDSFEQPMIKFVVTRGLKTRSEAHGLIGQFWGVPVNVTRYTGGLLPSAQPHSGTYYTLQFNAANPSQRRTFTAKLGWTTWRLNFIPTLPGYRCFYAGNSQGGRSIEATDPGVQDSVIEGKYQDYIASGLFDTQWHDEFSRFKQQCN